MEFLINPNRTNMLPQSGPHPLNFHNILNVDSKGLKSANKYMCNLISGHFPMSNYIKSQPNDFLNNPVPKAQQSSNS